MGVKNCYEISVFPCLATDIINKWTKMIKGVELIRIRIRIRIGNTLLIPEGRLLEKYTPQNIQLHPPWLKMDSAILYLRKSKYNVT